MWFNVPQKWWQVPGWLVSMWRAGQAAETGPSSAKATETSSRAATSQTPGAVDPHQLDAALRVIRRSDGREEVLIQVEGGQWWVPWKGRGSLAPSKAPEYLREELHQIRKLTAEVRPESCCEGAPMVAAGEKHTVCTDECKWAKLDLLVATAIVDAETC